MELFDKFGYYIGPTIPNHVVKDCSHVGECFEDVEYWQKELDFQVPRAMAIKWLREFGAWLPSELEEMGDVELAQKVLWLACCDIRENGEWFGLTN
jgi:hypothetical protein